jgi:hypothetical protein
VILGPSLLSGLIPVVGEWILPQTACSGILLEVVALIGVMLLLVVTGLETDLGVDTPAYRSGVRRCGRWAGVPVRNGLALGFMLPDDLLVDPGQGPCLPCSSQQRYRYQLSRSGEGLDGSRADEAGVRSNCPRRRDDRRHHRMDLARTGDRSCRYRCHRGRDSCPNHRDGGRFRVGNRHGGAILGGSWPVVG